MFKYLKNINGSHAIPEVIVAPVYTGVNINAGSLCSLKNGEVGSDFEENDTVYLCLDKKVKGDGKTSVRCIKVNPDMLFEVKVVNDVGEISLSCGSRVSWTTFDEEYMCAITPTEGGRVEIIEKNDYEMTGKVRVIIH